MQPHLFCPVLRRHITYLVNQGYVQKKFRFEKGRQTSNHYQLGLLGYQNETLKDIKMKPPGVSNLIPSGVSNLIPQEPPKEPPKGIQQCEIGKAVSPVCSQTKRITCKNQSDTESDNTVQTLFDYWRQIMDHPKAKLDAKRKQIIKKALKLGFSMEDLKQAIDGCKNSSWHMGENDRRKKFDGLSLIFRDAEKIESFIRMATEEESSVNGKVPPPPVKGVIL